MENTAIQQDNGAILDRHILFWDLKHNRPVLPGNQVVNPHTGVVEDIGPEGCIIGPPAIDFFVHNIRLPPGPNPFRGLRTALVSTLDDVIAEIGKHVHEGEYKLMSLNASRYSVIVVLMSSRDADDLGEVFNLLKINLTQKTVKNSREAAAIATAVTSTV